MNISVPPEPEQRVRRLAVHHDQRQHHARGGAGPEHRSRTSSQRSTWQRNGGNELRKWFDETAQPSTATRDRAALAAPQARWWRGAAGGARRGPEDLVAGPAAAGPDADRDDRAGHRAARRVRVRADARPGDGVPELRPLRRVPAQPVGRPGQLPAAVHRPRVLACVLQHARAVLGPAGAVLPGPDRAGHPAGQPARPAAAGVHPGRGDAAALLLLGHGHHHLPADARRHRAAGHVPAPARRGQPVRPHDRPGRVQVPGRRPADLEGSRLVDDRLPGRPGRDQPVAVRGGRGGRGRLVAAAPAHHAARPEGRSRCCCSSSTWATR